MDIDTVRHMDNVKVSLTYMTDFIDSCKNYIDKIDYMVFPSEYFANHYGKISEKNLYLGSPKYDCKRQCREELLEKYNLSDDKYALVVYPRIRDIHRINLDKIYDFVRRMGYKVLVKTRGKDPVHTESHKGDHIYMDYSWYPHDTMELAQLSDFIINFDSTVIKECVMMRTPLINYNIKPNVRHGSKKGIRLKFLYDYRYCKQLEADSDFERLKEAVEYLVNSDLSSEFDRSIEKHLFEGNSSQRILATLEQLQRK